MKYNILLIDDELSTLTHLIDFLSDFYEVSACDNSETFFDLIEKKSFDLFLLDINMPGMTGLEICKVLKENKKFKYIPIIFVTAFSDIAKIENSFSLGAADYVIKPFKLQELNIRINARIKNSLIENKLRSEQLKLNNEIAQLTKDLELREENFQFREDSFQETNIKIEQQKEIGKAFDKKFEEIRKKLKKQQELLENTRNLLNMK